MRMQKQGVGDYYSSKIKNQHFLFLKHVQGSIKEFRLPVNDF